MGLFKRSAKPAFIPPEVPLDNVRKQSTAAAPERKASMFERVKASVALESPVDPATGLTHGAAQTSFLGRRISQVIVPAFARKASLASAERDRDPRHLRLGESLQFDGADGEKMVDAFGIRPEYDDASDEEMEEKLEERRRAKGKGKAEWQSGLGWQQPKSGKSLRKELKKKEREKRRHRSKRAMKDFDSDLNAFNEFAQNGIGGGTPLNTSLHPSQASLPSIFQNPGIVSSNISSEELFLPAQPDDDGRPRAVPVGDGYDALDVMADHIFRIGHQKKKWFKAPRMGSKKDIIGTGVTIRAKVGRYRTFPVGYNALDEFEEAISRLNPEVAIKIKSDIVGNIFQSYINASPSMSELVIDEDTRIQILDEVSHLARARKHQYAAFIRDEEVLCVWADHVEAVIPAAEALEESLVNFIWRGEDEAKKINQAMIDDEMAEKDTLAEESSVVEPEDPEDVVLRKVKKHWRERPVMLYAPIMSGLAIILCLGCLGLGFRTIMKEYALDGKPMRFILMIFAIPLFTVSFFAATCVINSIFQILGPIRQVTSNSAYFSGIAPKRTMGELAHVTVQMPVFKENLEEVIVPTIESLKRAITTYERQGGSVGILICDDGLQLLDKAEADRRRAYYYNNNIAYIARPGHNVDGYVRKGRFKKAGNLNFANTLSLRVEEVMDDLRPIAKEASDEDHFWNEDDEGQVYDSALAQVLEEREGKAWAEGNIRYGPFILIVDSDTRVPEDCFADAVSEMAESPEVAIVQHASGVMQVANHFFENGVAFFTRSIQYSISFVCASGEVAPFVGHNAFIRWAALQECAEMDNDDGVMKVWSESHVSEDFQIAISLQTKGWVIRWATYSNGEFEEGVSLTCDDELNRWQKYSYGCSELVYNPFKSWFRGPFTPLFRKFLWTSGIPTHSKFSICGYIFSYTAIGVAWLLTTANYFIVGLSLPLDGYYLTSWEITLVTIILFVGLCNIALITLRYRLKVPGCGKMAADQIKWIPFFAIFFSGMSMPMSAALMSHLVGYNMTWSATVKTVEKSNFFLQLPLIVKRFYPQLIFFTLCVAIMIVGSTSLIPAGFRVVNLEVTVPLGIISACHLLWPFALNPWFISFSF